MDLLSSMSSGFDTDASRVPGGGVQVVVVTELDGIITEEGPVAQRQNVEIYRGDNRTFKIIAKDADGAVVNITGATAIFSVKKKLIDAAYIFQKTTANPAQISITEPTDGELEVYILPADTQEETPGDYEYDCQLTTSGNVYTIVIGRFKIHSEVTRP